MGEYVINQITPHINNIKNNGDVNKSKEAVKEHKNDNIGSAVSKSKDYKNINNSDS